MFWWERGGCRVRAKREENKNKEKGEEKEGWTFCLMQPRKWDKDRTLGQPKSDKRRGQLGWDTWKTREEKSHSLFPHFSTFLHSHSNFSTKDIITLHIYIYISLPSQSYIHNIKIAYMFHNITISKLHARKVN